MPAPRPLQPFAENLGLVNKGTLGSIERGLKFWKIVCYLAANMPLALCGQIWR